MQEINGKKYIRVSEFLSPFSGMEHVNEIVLDNAAKRGTRVHSICEGIARGLGEFDVESELEGYIQSFKHWWKEDWKIIAMEKRFYCDDLDLTGQIDFLLERDGRLTMCDLKTSSSVSKTWKVQGSAYAYLLNKSGYQIDGIEFIKLNRNGKPPRVCRYDIDIPFFMSCLDVYKYFYVKGLPHEKREEEERTA